MTGLNMKTAEDWQVQNYGIGGHYDGKSCCLSECLDVSRLTNISAHYDFFVGEDVSPFANGNRVATVLLYVRNHLTLGTSLRILF